MSRFLRGVLAAAGLGAVVALGAAIAGVVLGWSLWLVVDIASGADDMAYLPEGGAYIGLGFGVAVFLVRIVQALVRPYEEAVAERKAGEEERGAELEAARQRRLLQLHTLGQISGAAVAQFEALPRHLGSAENWIDRAEVLFREPSFSPFWEAIENSYTSLGEYRASLRAIREGAARYFAVAGGNDLEGCDLLAFPISVADAEAAGAADVVEGRLAASVAAAHRDHRFSSIYEQRRNTEAVVAGFRGLHGAIQGMRASLVGSLQDVREELKSGHDRLNVSIAAGATVTAQAVDRAAARGASGAEDRARHRELVRRVDRTTEELQRRRTW